MEQPTKNDDVPVRQDIMPPNPRTAAAARPAGAELVDHIPVREMNQIAQLPPAKPQPQQANPKPQDNDLENILKEVNHQVASADMSPKKKKRFGFSKKTKAAPMPQPAKVPAKAATKPKKIYVVDGVAVLVAIGLIGLAVKIYH